MSLVNLQNTFSDLCFSADLSYFINKYYDSIPEVDSFKMRSRKLFVWSYEGSRQLVFDNVPHEHRDTLYNINVIAILLNVIVDDLADMVSDVELLNVALQVLENDIIDEKLFNTFPKFKSYLMLASEIRNYLFDTIKKWPTYTMWLSDLAYFLKRLQIAMKKSLNFNKSILLNTNQNWDFSDYVITMAPPIHTFIYGILNLMILDKFIYKEREDIIRVLQKGEQYMAMSNWMSTWEVEIESKDFTSGVVVWALNEKIITTQELKTSSIQTIKEKMICCGCEKAFEQKMESIITDIQIYQNNITTFQVSDYIENLRRVHSLHLNFSQMLKY